MPLRCTAVVSIGLYLIMQAGCASSPQVKEQAQAKAKRVEAILTETSGAAEYVEAERCLSGTQYRHIQILDDRHIVFEGRRDQYWLNQLPVRCPGLRRGSTIAIERVSGMGRLCKLDSIAVYDWVNWPWYRRWPWPWGAGPKCGLGEFQPITPLQLEGIKAALQPARD